MPLWVIVLLLAIILPIAWLVSEFQHRRWVRLSLGISAMLMCLSVAILVGVMESFNSNAWFGGVTQDLIDTTIQEIEKGNTDKVVSELKRLREQYHPTYEHRARYDVLVDETVTRMKSADAQPKHPNK
jgi:hypothetical protein